MKIIDCNDWTSRNIFNMSIPITDPPVDLQGLLVAYSPGGLLVVIYSFLNREDDYFNEDD
jgi:hypothetical protein